MHTKVISKQCFPVTSVKSVALFQSSLKLVNEAGAQLSNKDHKLVEASYSLEQYIGLKEDKLSSTTVDFIRSEGNLETKRLYWFSKPKMC